MATPFRISELDFNSIRENIKNYLKSQSEFTDFDFDGSGLSVLIDILAYNTHYMGYYLNMVGNEMFLDTAQLRSSVLSLAKLTNYVPRSRTGSTAIINVVVTPPDGDTEGSLVLPRFSRFASESIDATNYVFATTDSYIVPKVDGKFTFNNVAIKQGETANLYYTVTDGNRKFVLPSSNVDTSTVTVTVQESSSNTFITTYKLSDDLTEIDGNSKVFFLEETPDDNYLVYFGDGVLGYRPANNNIVIIKYIDSLGAGSNKANSFININPIGGYSNVEVQSVSPAVAGADKETVEQIKFRAPISYTSQNRAVTKNDYESLLKKDYPNITSISVWSGDENIPPVYGKVFISMKPVTNYEITSLEKDRIIREIIANRGVLTVTPEIIDPNYTYLLFRINVNWNKDITDLDTSQIESLVRASIQDYITENLSDFNSVYRNSVLHDYIDNAHQSILSSQITTFLQKRITLVPNTRQNYEIDFATTLHRGGLIEAMYTYPSVKTYDSSNVERDVLFEEVPGAFTGLDSIKIINRGINYTSNPTVTITGDGTGATARATIVNGKVDSITVLNRGRDYTRASVSITGGGGSGATASPQLQFRNGTIRSYYYKQNGEKVIVNPLAGTIDYENGKIKLNSLYVLSVEENQLFESNVLSFNIKPDSDIVKSMRNSILDVDFGDPSAIQVEIEAE
jgi:hypothetical protein